MNRTFSRSVVVAGVAALLLGATACTSVDEPAPEQSVSTEGTAAEAKQRVDAFLEDVRDETLAFSQGNTEIGIESQYSKTFENFDESVDAEQGAAVIEAFSFIYLIDSDAVIESDEASFVVEGDTASISGGDFKLTLNGEVVETDPSESSGSIELKYSDGEWLITGMGE